MSFRDLPSRSECESRLRLIFPRDAFDSALANPLGAAAVATMLYVDAVVPSSGNPGLDAVWVRPSTVLWMSDEIHKRNRDEDRIAWRTAAFQTKKRHFMPLLRDWGITYEPWYADNSREPLRDETLTGWLNVGAVRVRPGVPSTSPMPRWALTESFADLFDPSLQGDALDQAIDTWRSIHLSPGARVRLEVLKQREQSEHAVEVTLPNGIQRFLEPGNASLIIKGVIEQWARSRFGSDFYVLTISEPGDKVYLADQAILARLGISIDVNDLLPDAVIVDVASEPAVFWIIEVIATDGVITDVRKEQMIRWANDQSISTESCQFLSAFFSRNSDSARKRLKDLADGTYAWYLDEPGRELAWYEIS